MAFTGCLASILCILCIVKAQENLIKDEEQARAWLDEYNILAQEAYYADSVIAWNYFTNLTDHNSQLSVESGSRLAAFKKEAYQNASKFDWRNFQDADLRRLFQFVTDIGSAVLPAEKVKRLNTLGSELEKMYSTGKVCNKPGDSSKTCYDLDPGLTNILAKERDWDTLVWAWRGWRNATGRLMKDKYEEFVSFLNEAAKMNKFANAGDYWRFFYEMDNFEAECDRLWNQVKPLYQNLHAYVRRKLMDKYADRTFPASGHIPAHLLGNMWAQEWSYIFKEVEPFKGKAGVDITDALVNQGYNATAMTRLSEEFFMSLGLEAMPDSFWQNSMLEKPTDRDVVCHASAWDFSKNSDVRIKQCTEPTMAWLITTHHEMGHIAYYLAYKHLHILYRGGANPGFHEAVGDVLALSVATPEHLVEIGLLDKAENDQEADINYLMSMALDKIAFLPFGFLMDQWRWSVFRGDTPKSRYNKKWWELRCKYQGISPPVTRSEEDFDPGAKYHIPSNTPYIRYFISFIIQFQFHRALCEAANNTRPLHRCDIYRSQEAGLKLQNMLKLGMSKPWQEAFEQLTGTRQMDASAIVEYFKPLNDWLTEQNRGLDIAWEEKCPQGSFADSVGLATTLKPPALFVIGLCSVLWFFLSKKIF